MLGCDESIKLISIYCKVVGTILLFVVTLWIDVETDLGYLYGSFGGSDNGNP